MRRLSDQVEGRGGEAPDEGDEGEGDQVRARVLTSLIIVAKRATACTKARPAAKRPPR